MKVLKFGGTSVGTPQRMKDVSKLVTSDGQPKVVVLSAMSGTTNTLVEIADYLYKKNPEGANDVINRLEQKYMQHVEDLYETDEWRTKTKTFLHEEFNYLRSFTKTFFTSFEEKAILAQGEIISTNMVTNYMLEKGVKAILLSALDIIRTDKNAEPDLNYIREHTTALLESCPGYEIYITQGFICRNAYGEVDNLQRGGSDYTACLIGAAIQAEEIQIWTDIDGMHNNDPRIVEGTAVLRGSCRAGILRCKDPAPDMHSACQVRRRTCTSSQHDGPHSPGHYHQQPDASRHHQGCSCKGQHHLHQHPKLAHVAGSRFPEKGV